MKELILITGRDCPLCQDTLNMLEDLDLDSYIIKEKDVYETREQNTKYWDKIPVLLANDKELFWPFKAHDIEQFLSI